MSQQPTNSSDKPRFSAGLVTILVTLVWVALFAYFIVKGSQGL